ncbi:hypothetical protein [Aeromonas sp. Y311-2]|uniref:hypothetical protein n=1 Tax=Aeromonas sp. Y311-2 TaxID=2990507 RepID=UPI0022E97054|nr:hypothetical protein [Aeromonas sp. Y311-2]
MTMTKRVDGLSAILERLQLSLNTQSNRCTADPFFCVFSKREIVVDAEFDHDKIVWWNTEEHIDACERTTRWLDYREETYRSTGDWVKVAIKEVDEFVTACFTEQGCKDFLEIQGHNLRKPFIYVTGLFRNREMIALRDALMVGQLAEKSDRSNRAIADLVNNLRDTAIKYQGSQQLRTQLANIIVPVLKGVELHRTDLVRYCHECGHVGEVNDKHLDCCPSGQGSYVRRAVAEQARLSLSKPEQSKNACQLPSEEWSDDADPEITKAAYLELQARQDQLQTELAQARAALRKAELALEKAGVKA